MSVKFELNNKSLERKNDLGLRQSAVYYLVYFVLFFILVLQLFILLLLIRLVELIFDEHRI